MERCDGYRGRCNGMWRGVTVVRKCDSQLDVCQLVGKYDGYQESLGGVIIVRKCDSHQGGVKGI